MFILLYKEYHYTPYVPFFLIAPSPWIKQFEWWFSNRFPLQLGEDKVYALYMRLHPLFVPDSSN